MQLTVVNLVSVLMLRSVACLRCVSKERVNTTLIIYINVIHSVFASHSFALLIIFVDTPAKGIIMYIYYGVYSVQDRIRELSDMSVRT